MPQLSRIPTSAVTATWAAVPELTEILRGGSTLFVEGVWRALDMPAVTQVDPSRLAVAIDELGAGPIVAKRLLDACSKAWIGVKRVNRAHPEQLQVATNTALRLVATWLPRRYGDGNQAWLVDHPSLAANEGYCPDLDVAAYDPIMIDAHVAGADGLPLDVKVLRKDPEKEGPMYRFIGNRRLPNFGEDPLKEFCSAPEVARALIGYYATSNLREGTWRWRLQHLRMTGNPMYVVMERETPPDTLLTIKRNYPALRIVQRTPELDYCEAEILPFLYHLMIDADKAPSVL